MKPMALVMLLAISLPASAGEIYKCQNVAGKVEFRDTPCQGVAGEKVKVQSSSAPSGSADPMAAIRAQDAEFNARRTARLKAEASADAEANRLAERAYHEERSHRASEALVEAIREGNNQRAADYYNSTLVRPPYYRPYTSPSPTPQFGAAPKKK